MAKFCRYCGSELHTGAHFCAKCGSPVASMTAPAAPAPPAPVAPPAPAPQPSYVPPVPHAHPPQQVYSPAPSAYTRVEHAAVPRAAITKKRSNTLCIVLTVILLLQMAAVAMYGWPGFAVNKSNAITIGADSDSIKGYSNIRLTKKDLKTKPVTVEVGPESPVAKSGGVTVDFGEFNLTDTGSLNIRDIGIKNDEKAGLSAHCFDFSMDDVTDFATPVAITLPYGRVEGDPESMFVQYFNDETGEWEVVYSITNESAETITFYTDHFSTFAVFAHFTYIDYNKGPNSPVMFNSKMLDKLIDNCEADFESFMRMYKSNNPEDSGLVQVALDSLTSSDNLSSSVDTTVTTGEGLVKTVLGSENVSGFSKSLGKSLGRIGAGLTALKVGLSWYESGSATRAFQDNKYDIVQLGLSTAGVALGAAPLTVAASGVWLMGMTDDYTEEMYNAGYSNAVEHAYQEFTWNYVSYSRTAGEFGCKLPNNMPARALIDEMVDAVIINDARTWAWLQTPLVKKYRNDPQQLFKALEKQIDDYCNVFWRLKPNVRKMIAEDIHRSDAWSEPSAEERLQLTETVKAKLRYRLRLLFARIYERLMLDAKTKLLWEIQDLEAQMNTVTEFSIYVLDEEDKEIPLSDTDYKEYLAAFSTSPTEKPTIWSWYPGGDKPEFSCTLYNYIAIGAPGYVKFYKTWEDQVADEAAFTMPVTFAPNRVKIFIQEKGLSIDEIIGEYEVTTSFGGRAQSSNGVFTKNGDKLVLSSETIQGDWEFTYDPATGTASNIQYIELDDEEFKMVTTFEFSWENGNIEFTGTAVQTFESGESQTAYYSAFRLK